MPFTLAANQRVLIDGMFDPGKDRPAIALVLQARQGLRRELLSSAVIVPLIW
jgi:hypothetical protein